MVGRSVLLLWTFFALVKTESSSTSPKEVTAKPEENVILECHASEDADSIMLKWTKPDLKSDDYVFFFRDNKLYEHFQHPSFKGRVELRDPEMKNGDTSVILKNVTVNDTGTYECLVKTRSSDEFRRSVILNVTDPGHTAGHTEEGGDEEGGLREGGNLTAPLIAVVAAVICVCLGGVFLWKRQRPQQQNPDPPPADEDELQTLSSPSSNHSGTTEDRGDENGQDDNRQYS